MRRKDRHHDYKTNNNRTGTTVRSYIVELQAYDKQYGSDSREELHFICYYCIAYIGAEMCYN